MNKIEYFQEALKGGDILLYGDIKYANDFCYVYQTLGDAKFYFEYSDRIDMFKLEQYSKQYTAVVICQKNIKESIFKNVMHMEELFCILDGNSMSVMYEGRRPSEMIKETLYAPVIENIPCMFPFNTVSIGPVGGLVSLCECPGVLRVGHILNNSFTDIWNSIEATIYRCSMVNQTYCFCIGRSCRFDLYSARRRNKNNLDINTEKYKVRAGKLPSDYRIAHSGTCNLHCRQCRSKVIVDGEELNSENIKVSGELINYLSQAKDITLAGNGEVFVSQAYKNILDNLQNIFSSDKNSEKTLHILTNGNLMTKDVIDSLICKTQGHLTISVSVDAASESTYLVTRQGGDWNKLLTNLSYVGEKIRSGDIKALYLNYVIQQANISEMPDFVELGNTLGANIIHFTAIYNTGTYTDEEFEHVGILDEKGNIKEELLHYFNSPILHQSNVQMPYYKKMSEGS